MKPALPQTDGGTEVRAPGVEQRSERQRAPDTGQRRSTREQHGNDRTQATRNHEPGNSACLLPAAETTRPTRAHHVKPYQQTEERGTASRRIGKSAGHAGLPELTHRRRRRRARRGRTTTGSSCRAPTRPAPAPGPADSMTRRLSQKSARHGTNMRVAVRRRRARTDQGSVKEPQNAILAARMQGAGVGGTDSRQHAAENNSQQGTRGSKRNQPERSGSWRPRTSYINGKDRASATARPERAASRGAS